MSAYLFIQTFVNKKSMEQQVVRTSAHYANNKDIPTRHKGTSFEVEKNRVKNCTDHFSCKLFFHCPYFFPRLFMHFATTMRRSPKLHLP